TAALAALDGDHVRAQLDRLERMLERTYRRNAQHAGILEALDGVLVRAATVAHRTQAVLHGQIDTLGSVILEHMEIETEVAATGGGNHLLDLTFQLLGGDGRPSQKTEAAGARGGDHQVS